MNYTLKNNATIQIVPARSKDAKDVISYFKIVAEESQNLSFSTDEFTITIRQEEKLLESYFESPNQLYILAKMEDEIVGVLNLSSSNKRRLRHVGEFGVSVLKKYWNQGIGRLLLEHMLDWAKENDVTEKIMLRTNLSNESAMALYVKLGFTEEARWKKDFKVNNQYLDTIFMSKFIE